MALVDDARWAFFEAKQRAIGAERARLAAWRVRPGDVPQAWTARVLGGTPLARDASALELLRRPGIGHADLLELAGPSAPQQPPADPRLAPQLSLALEVEASYTGYIERARGEIERARSHESLALPDDLDYRSLAGLSNEIRQKLVEARPATLGQAARMPGVTPAAVSILLVHLKRRASR
jgi:tRNA uridine 5-carboxymethylaminomethyl modification enzyme